MKTVNNFEFQRHILIGVPLRFHENLAPLCIGSFFFAKKNRAKMSTEYKSAVRT